MSEAHAQSALVQGREDAIGKDKILELMTKVQHSLVTLTGALLA